MPSFVSRLRQLSMGKNSEETSPLPLRFKKEKMGSQPGDTRVLPDFSDPALVMTNPTDAEMEQTWRLNHGEWGGALDLEAYLRREPFLASTTLTSDGGMTHWILTEADDGRSNGEKRSILASCETIRKRVLYIAAGASPDVVKEGISYGIGSVYTYPQFRGKKYAARLLKDLTVALPTWEQKRLEKSTLVTPNGSKPEENQPQPNGHDVKQRPIVCTALWSDIGKKFYAAKGWPAYDSTQLEFGTDSPMASLFENDQYHTTDSKTTLNAGLSQEPHPELSLTLTPVTESNLSSLCATDEAQLRAEMSRRARADPARPVFAFTPDPDVFRWHWAREDFVSPHVFPGRSPSAVKGMVATVSTISTANGDASNSTQDGASASTADAQTRIWVIWGRNYGKQATNGPASDSNTLYILRLVIESPSLTSESPSRPPLDAATTGTPAQALAFRAVLQSAQDAARSWNCGKAVIWNPSRLVRDLAEQSGIAHKLVDRELDSIPSLMWYGDGSENGSLQKEESQGRDEVDWVANEKYCWC